MYARVLAIRTAAIGLCALTLIAGACSSSGGHTASSNTTEPTTPAPSTTADPNLTPNSIPYVVGERMGLPNGWAVQVAAVHYPASVLGLPAITAGQRYVVIDLTMQNNGTAQYAVDANKLFTLVDGLKETHYVVAPPGRTNGIDGPYPPGTSHSGQLIFSAPKAQKLGLILYGPRIGTQVSYFMVDPPSVPT